MRLSKAFTGIILTLVLLLGRILFVKAMPPLPSSFYGTVKIDGQYAPAGTRITARINGVIFAESTVTIDAGGTYYTLDVLGEDGDLPGKQGGEDGDSIVFFIGDLPASQTALWQSGINVELDLTTDTGQQVGNTVIYLPIIMRR